MSNINGIEPRVWRWDFDGSCAPRETPEGFKPPRCLGRYETFSLGVFQWIPKAGGRGLKRSKVVARIKGRVDNPMPAFQRAHQECRARREEPMEALER